MNVDPTRSLALAQIEREAAHGAFQAQLSQVKADLAARSIGGRAADRASETAARMADEAIIIADENRGIIAGTIAALAAWFLRKPIARGCRRIADGIKKRI